MLPAEITRHRFTVEEYHKMAEAGVFSEDDRVELIGGEVVQMTPIGWCHARCVSNLNMLLARFAGDRFVVSVQNPIIVDEHGEPQPDLALLREVPTGRLPGPGEVVLVVGKSPTLPSRTTRTSSCRSTPAQASPKHGSSTCKATSSRYTPAPSERLRQDESVRP